MHRTRVFQIRSERVVLAIFYAEFTQTPTTLGLQLALLPGLIFLYWLGLAFFRISALGDVIRKLGLAKEKVREH